MSQISNKTFKVGMLLSRFYPHEGGAETQCRYLSLELLRKNNNIFILTQALPRLEKHERIDELDICRIGLPFKGRFGSLIYVITGFFWLLMNKSKFDLLHAHLASSPAVLAGIFSKYFNKPSVLKLGGSRKTGDISTSYATWFGKYKLNFLIKNISAFVAPSLEIKQELLKSGFSEDKIFLIQNGVNTSIFLPKPQDDKKSLRQKLNLPTDRKIAIYSGRLVKGKGLDILLEAWADIEMNLKEQNPYLIILGKGDLEKSLKERYSKLESVRFCGWKNNVSEYLSASDIFLLPSSGEGLSNSLLEAMSCGLACISTDIGGISEVIRNNENGILIQPENSSELYESIKSLLTNTDLAKKIGKNARLYIENNLSISKTAASYVHLYNKLLN